MRVRGEGQRLGSAVRVRVRGQGSGSGFGVGVHLVVAQLTVRCREGGGVGQRDGGGQLDGAAEVARAWLGVEFGLGLANSDPDPDPDLLTLTS